jgi:hypothetical protein
MMGDDDNVIITDPTIGEFRALLEQFDQSMPFRIVDPDTFWTIGIFHLYVDKGTLWLGAEYSEMDRS